MSRSALALALTPPPARYGIDDHPLSGIKPEEWMTRSARLTAEGLSRLAVDLDGLMEVNKMKERASERTR